MKKFELSQEQIRLWVDSQRDSDSVLLHTHLLLSLKGRLNVARLRNCVQIVLKQEPAFNAYFTTDRGIPYLCIHDYPNHSLEFVDFRTIATEHNEIEYIEKESSQSIDLKSQPCYRIKLYQSKQDNTYYLSCVVPHILIDLQSCHNLFNKLSSLYNQSTENDKPIYILTKGNNVLYGEMHTRYLGLTHPKSKEYWRDQLSNKQTSLDYSHILRKNAGKHARSHRDYICESRQISPLVLKGVRMLSRKLKTTPFLIFMSIYGSLIHRYTGQKNFSIVYPVSNRYPDDKAKIGHFANLVPCTFDFSEEMTVLDVIHQVTHQRKASHMHDHYPYASIHRYVRSNQQDTFNLLCSRTILFSNYEFADLEVEQIPLRQGHVGFGWSLLFDIHNSEGMVCFEYDRNQFHSWFARQVIDHFMQVIGSLNDYLQQSVSSGIFKKTLLPQSSLAQSTTSTTVDKKESLWCQLDRVMHKYANRMALSCGTSSIKYKQLQLEVNALAGYLHEQGVSVRIRVAILLPHDQRYIITILSLVRLGAIYVPIDRKYPQKRISYIIEDADIQYVICCQDGSQQCKQYSNIKLISLDQYDDELYKSRSADEGLLPKSNHNDLLHNDWMYIVYTSGTTGKPKGVPITYKAISELMVTCRSYFKFAPDDIWTLTHSFAFDFSVWEMWGALLNGALIDIVPDNIRNNPLSFYQHLHDNQVTICNITPSYFRNLAAVDSQYQLTLSLRYVIFGGEKLLFADVQSWLSRHGDAQPKLINMYGLSEVPIHATYHRVQLHDQQKGQSIIGKPLDGIGIEIVGDQNQELPCGVYGEMRLMSPNITDGYLNLDEINQQKFRLLQDGTKLYRTGDYACFLPDGSIDFRGRVDQQIKLNGYRIELEEINKLLQNHPSVDTALCIVDSDCHRHSKLIALCVSKSKYDIKNELYCMLKESLPGYMIPADIIFIDKIPLTNHGKIDLLACSKLIESPSRSAVPAARYKDLCREVALLWQELLGFQQLDPHLNYFDHGGDSISLLRLQASLEKLVGRKIPLQDLFQYTTVESQARYLANLPVEEVGIDEGAITGEKSFSHSKDDEIAIIGLSVNVPGASTVEQFLDNIILGVESITTFTGDNFPGSTDDDRNHGVNAGDSSYHAGNYVTAKGYIPDGDKFDADFFGYASHDAEWLDPQHRLLLEHGWSALENSGYVTEEQAGKVGVFVGQSNVGSYYQRYILPRIGSLGISERYQALIQNSPDFLANRLAYKLNLTGPAMTVQTGCSTSMVAVCQAVQSLRNNECSMAIAGGVCLTFPLQSGYEYQEGMILSKDGHCRPFDEAADGTVPGNGIGVIVLKRLQEARQAGDNILSIIKGCAINNDGGRKLSFTAPSEQGQIDVISAAIKNAAIDPTTIRYIETHGTGTRLGDPIEVSALKKSLLNNRGGHREHQLVIGSVKSNIGHLDAAAGIVGLIKTVLCLQNKILPPTVHFKAFNRFIQATDKELFVLQERQPWESEYYPRRAGVSSFGVGGTNAHVILEENQERRLSGSGEASEQEDNIPVLVIVSAKTPQALEASRLQLLQHIKKHDGQAIRDIAYTLQVGRRHFPHRFCVASDSREEMIKQLAMQSSCIDPVQNIPCYFVFADHNLSPIESINSLYENFSVFKSIVLQCVQYSIHKHQIDLRKQFALNSCFEYDLAGSKTTHEEVCSDLSNSFYLFIINYALAKQMMMLGIVPKAVFGYGMGEYIAACLSGIWSLEDTLSIMVKRHNLMQGMQREQVIEVECHYDKIKCSMPPTVRLVAVMSSNQCMLAGPANVINKLCQELTEEGLDCRLTNSISYDHKMVSEMKQNFVDFMKGLKLSAPTLPIISSITGEWLASEDACSPIYWGEQMYKTIFFSQGVETLLKQDQQAVFLEMVSDRMTTSWVQTHDEHQHSCSMISYGQYTGTPHKHMLENLGQLWMLGYDIHWDKMNIQGGKRVPLPSYPFQRQCYMLQEEMTKNDEGIKTYQPCWVATPLAKVSISTERKCYYLLINPEISWVQNIQERVGNEDTILQIYHDQQLYFSHKGGRYDIDLGCKDSWAKILSGMIGAAEVRIAYFWPQDEDLSLDSMHEHSTMAHYIKTYATFLQALSQYSSTSHHTSIIVTFIARGLYDIYSYDQVNPLNAALLGIGETVKNEFTKVIHRIVDLPSGVSLDLYADIIAKEVLADHDETQVAYRGMKRLSRHFSQVILENQDQIIVSPHSVYIITGGLGHIGLVFAECLSAIEGIKLVLISKNQQTLHDLESNSELMSETELKDYDRWVKVKNQASSLKMVFCDITDYNQMKEEFKKIRADYGCINGVIHAAGSSADGVITEIGSSGEIGQLIEAKVQGTYHLHHLTIQDDLDCMVLCSSLSAIAGDYSQAIYNSANTFLDAFSSWRSKMYGHTMSINWDAWSEGGMATGWMKRWGVKFEGIKDQDALAIIPSLLCHQVAQLVVSAQQLPNRLSSNFLGNFLNKKQNNKENLKGFLEEGIDDYIEQLWVKYLDYKPNQFSEDFYELGGDSLLAVQLASLISDRCQVLIYPHHFIEYTTLSGISAYIKSQLRVNVEAHCQNTAQDDYMFSLVSIHQSAQNQHHVFLIHPIGGTVHVYRHLAPYLKDSCNVYALQAKAVNGHSDSELTIEEMAADYIRCIKSIQAQGEYIIGGASLGGLLAYEITQQLTKSGDSIRLLFFMDTPSPQHYPKKISQPEAVIKYLLEEGALHKTHKEFDEYSLDEQIRYFLKNAGKLLDAIPNLDFHYLKRFLKIYQHNMQAMLAYKIEPPMNKYQNIQYYRASVRTDLNPDHPEDGWVNLFKGQLSVHNTPGNHITMLLPPAIDAIGKHLASIIGTDKVRSTDCNLVNELIREAS